MVASFPDKPIFSQDGMKQGVIGILTHQGKTIFLPLPKEDFTCFSEGGKQKSEKVRGVDTEYTALSLGMLGLVSGGVRTSLQLESVSSELRQTILEENLVRETQEEFATYLSPEQKFSRAICVGVIDQIRAGKPVSFLLWALLSEEMGEQQVEALEKKAMHMGGSLQLIENHTLPQFVQENSSSLRPSTRETVIRAYDLISQKMVLTQKSL